MSRRGIWQGGRGWQPDGEVAVAGGLDACSGRHRQEVGQQVAAILGCQPIGGRHEIEVAHRAVSEIEGQRGRTGEIEIRAPGTLAELRQQPTGPGGERLEAGRGQASGQSPSASG